MTTIDLALETGRRPLLTSHSEVVQASIDLLEAHGPEGLTMRKLASQLNVSLPTVYAAIGSRERLIRDILEVMVRRLLIDSGVQVASAGQRSSAVVAAVLRWVSAHRWVLSLIHEVPVAVLGQVWQLIERSGHLSSDQLLGALSQIAGQDMRAGDSAALATAAVFTIDFVDRLLGAGCFDDGHADELAVQLLRVVLLPAATVSHAA